MSIVVDLVKPCDLNSLLLTHEIQSFQGCLTLSDCIPTNHSLCLPLLLHLFEEIDESKEVV